ncbi:MAG TPA: TlpA disulfide reductase family protein [Gammaproteobacteria bacterium]
MNAKHLTRKPTLVTVILSAVALCGYAAYRLAGSGQETDSRFANELPQIVLNDLAGAPTPLATWSEGPMLVNFWATWCAPCLREIPLLKSFQEQHPTIEVVGIAVDQLEPVLDFAEEMQFNYPVLVGRADGYEAMTIFRNEAQVMPFSAFTAPGGAVLGVHYGELHAEHLDNFATTVELLGSGEIDLGEARDRLDLSH